MVRSLGETKPRWNFICQVRNKMCGVKIELTVSFLEGQLARGTYRALQRM
jgi:hypothetical protein